MGNGVSGLRDAFYWEAGARRIVEPVNTPAGPVFVHSLTAGEKDRFDIGHAKAKGEHFRARLTVASTRDEDGNSIFDEDEIEAISNWPTSLIEPIVDAALRINRMTDKDSEALAKN